ncbi:tetratricopeptide repeat protein [Syntrophomonas erecta subsp. sporosyntropha]
MKTLADNSVAALQSAEQKIQNHDISGALEELLIIYRHEPNQVEPLNLTAACYFTLGEFERAEACWNEVLKLDEQNTIAKEKLNKFNSPSFQFWLNRYQEALQMVEKKNYREAAEILHRLMEENARVVSIYQIMGLCYLAQSQEKEAVRMWRRGLELDITHKSLKSYLQLKDQKKPGRPKQVRYEMEEPVPQPFFDKTRLGFIAGVLCLALLAETGIMMSKQEASQKTIKSLQNRINSLTEQVTQQPVVAIADVNLKSEDNLPTENKYILDAKFETSMAGSQYDIAQENHYYNNGLQAYRRGDWKTAESNLSMVVAMQSHSYLHREALYYLARCYYLQEKYQMAEQYYQIYLKEFPGSNYYDDSLYFLGLTYFNIGNAEAAKNCLSQLQELDPQSGYISSQDFKTVMQF